MSVERSLPRQSGTEGIEMLAQSQRAFAARFSENCGASANVTSQVPQPIAPALPR
jgi:hypothetical protein